MSASNGNGNSKVGAVLVIGAGIAGIQSSIDLADSGFKVHLLEKSPAIGGVMSQLDKTFPTNDCSMCILSPKLVECGRHLNIDTMTWSELESISGQAGDFKVKVRRKSRFIDLDKCTGCGDCAKACPVDVPNEFEENLNARKAVYRPYPQAFPNCFVIDKLKKAPCRDACPAGINGQGYVALISAGKFKESLALIREEAPFPAVLGRVCNHPCESACKRGEYDEAVSICFLKRFVADHEMFGEGAKDKVKQENMVDPSKEKIAIIGAGPAGLTAADNLARKGYPVTVFEALPVGGGMLAVGIPEYRLPQAVLNEEIKAVQDLGVEIKYNTRIGKDIAFDQLLKDYKAVLIAVGAHVGRKLEITGEELEGVTDCVAFLRDVNLGKKPDLGKRVAVIGGGNSAIDSARVATRSGAGEVTIIYRRSLAEMPANPAEIEEARHEGVKIHYLAAPVEIIGSGGKVTQIKCIKMELGKPDESGRRRPVPVEGSEFVVDVDTIIPAISQSADISFLEEKHGVAITRWGTPHVDDDTAVSDVANVFACGDAVSGPATVVEAIAEGKKAARSIERYLNGEELKVEKEAYPSDEEYDLPDFVPLKQRAVMPAIPVQKRKGFDEVETGFTAEQAIEEAKRCLNCGVCSECMECFHACQAGAIDHRMGSEIEEINVGAILLTLGFAEFDPAIKTEYGYGRFPNVLSSIQFERMMSASGPYEGHIQRPSDGKTPRKVAWLQCVGSRDTSCGNGYCSSVCCMYAIKEAVIAKEHENVIEPTIFFMDMRTYGKDFDKYYERSKDEYGVNFVRARVSSVEEGDNPGDLTLVYETEDGTYTREQFDLVVLSVGLSPPKDIEELAGKLDVRLNEYNFVETSELSPLSTSVPGIFVAGALSAPKDIPETVAQASGAAAEVSSLLASERGTMVKKKEYPPEKDLRGFGARVGVFVCHCGINIGGIVDVPAVVKYTWTLPDVVYVGENLYTCSQDTQEMMKELIEEHRLTHVVVASCTPRTHEPLFRETMREAGLNPYLFAMANIRDQCSWVHMDRPADATEKAKDLVRMSVAKAKLLRPLNKIKIDVIRKGMVVGAGLTGMTAALKMAEEGFETYLVEKEAKIGGNLAKTAFTLETYDLAPFCKDLRDKVQSHPLIRIFKNSTVTDVQGFVGNFHTTITNKDGDSEEVEHGVIIIATGGNEMKPTEFLYGEDDRVITQKELERALGSGLLEIKEGQNFVMIQCVGSRNEEHPYCSRVCCAMAVKNAIRLKQTRPDANIYVLYRDMRTYGFKEKYYQQARDLGVIFIRFDKEDPPKVTKNGSSLKVQVKELLVKRTLEIDADSLVLSAGIEPPADNDVLAQMLKVPLNADGFFLEAHMKLRPVEFATEGVLLAGLAHSPKLIEESISQANATVSRSCTVLSSDFIEAEGTIAFVDEVKCVACGDCERVCPFNAVELKIKSVMRQDKLVSEVNAALCKGCGTCTAACRSNAINLHGFNNQQIVAEIESF
jgi:heterodisulfide reductase subunit A2